MYFAYPTLHLFNLLGAVLLGGLRELVRTFGFKLFQFGSDEHSRSPRQLKVSPLQVPFLGQKQVDQINRYVECLPFDRELVADVHHPFEQGYPHFPIEILLVLLNVMRRNQVVLLAMVQVGDCLSL